MHNRRLAVMLMMLIGALIAAPAGAQSDADCSDFASQAAAQAYFFSKGGAPTNNIDGLDRDADGWACERNPPPYASGFSSSQVNEGGPTNALPQTGSGGYLSSDVAILSPFLILVGALALSVTLISGGLYLRRSLQ